MSKLISIFLLGCLCGKLCADQTPMCERYFNRIALYYKDIGMQPMINEWNKYESVCSANGFHKRKVAEINKSFGRFDESELILREEIEKATYDKRDLYNDLAYLYFSNNDKQTFRKISMDLIRDYPKSFYGYLNMAVFHIYTEEWEDAMSYLDRAAELGDDYSIYTSRSIVNYELGNDELVCENFNKALKQDYILALLTRRAAAMATISNVKLGNFELAEEILSFVEKNDETIQDYEGYKAAKKFYLDNVNRS